MSLSSPPPHLQQTVERKSDGETEPIRVLYVGRLSREKGVDVLLRAWAILDRQGKDTPTTQSNCALCIPHCALTIVGDGPERPALEALAESCGISDRVTFTGALPHDEALAVLKTASLLVLPSVCYEQFAITPLEAMTFGVPTLTSDVARYGTIIEEGVTGQFFATGDPEALADALHDLLAAPDVLRRMGEAARAAFPKSDCIPSRNLSRLLSIYASCRATSSAPSGI